MLTSWQFPRENIPFTIVVCWMSIPLVCTLMNNLNNFIYKYNDFIMEAICDLRKLLDLAEGKDHIHLSSWDLPLNKSFVVSKGSGDNLSTFFTEASLKQCTYFEDSQL